MKIGILTLPLHFNYGGILQAYALQTVLERMGNNVEIIDYPFGHPKKSWIKWSKIWLRRTLSILCGKKIYVFYEQKEKKLMPIMCQYTNRFINTYINKSEYHNELTSVSKDKYDAIVVGSDQVWRKKFSKDIKTAYLSFTADWNIKRISYAASFGTDEWEYSNIETNECKKAVKLFSAVSVREKSAVKVCRDYLNTEAEQVLDPTMLLAKEDYIALVERNNTPKSSGTLFSYILDYTAEKDAVVSDIARHGNLIPFRVNAIEGNHRCPIEKRIAKPVEQWLRAFMDAEMIVTDSFHACVFSILFNKPFVVIANPQRGLARFRSLLDIFGLTDRLESANAYIPIDYKKVNKVLKKERARSLEFLKNNL